MFIPLYSLPPFLIFTETLIFVLSAMERFMSELTTIEEQDQINQASKLNKLKDPLDNFHPKISDLCLADSFLDFDAIKEFFDDKSPKPDRISLEKIEFGVQDKMNEEKKCHSDGLVSDESGSLLKAGEKNLSGDIEEEIRKVSLAGVNSEILSFENVIKEVDLVGDVGSVLVDESGVKSGPVSAEDTESDSDSESESSTSSSSSTASDDDNDDDDDDDEKEYEDKEEKEVKEVKGDIALSGELEEGEIEGVDRKKISGRIDDDEDDDDDEDEEQLIGAADVDIFDEDEIGAAAAEGPIRSKNELQVLPPVPEVKVALEPHHQMLPVGVVLSVLGAQVIVEGVEKHNPLNEGSILWITESRLPLGLIDEIFGPVKNPYYMVRYNSESEIPAGIHAGTSISFVQDFANHVLNDKNLYKKGYDASGENDEELPDEVEFSDDEKEAEYKRRQKMEKRGMKDQNPGNKKSNSKKVKNKDGMWRNGRHSVPQGNGVGQPPPTQNQFDQGNSSASTLQNFGGGTGLSPQLQQMMQNSGYSTSPSPVWTNGIPPQQPQSPFFPNAFATNGFPWPSQNYQQHSHQPMINGGLFLQQPCQMSIPNVGLPGRPSNFFAGPMYASWQGIAGQNGLNPTVGRGLPRHAGHPSVNAGPVQQNNLQHAPLALPDSSFDVPQRFNMGSSSSRGRNQYNRGGRSARGRGRQ